MLWNNRGGQFNKVVGSRGKNFQWKWNRLHRSCWRHLKKFLLRNKIFLNIFNDRLGHETRRERERNVWKFEFQMSPEWFFSGLYVVCPPRGNISELTTWLKECKTWPPFMVPFITITDFSKLNRRSIGSLPLLMAFT